MKKKITVTRKTTESSIQVTVEKGTLAADYRQKIRTPLPFLNHMIEHIAWRAALNISIDLSLSDFDLVHLVTEDVSMTLGKAVGEFVRLNAPCGYGVGVGIIDEAPKPRRLFPLKIGLILVLTRRFPIRKWWKECPQKN